MAGERFETLYRALGSGDLQELRRVEGLVRRQPVVVHVGTHTGKVRGRLCTVVGRKKGVALDEVAASAMEVGS